MKAAVKLAVAYLREEKIYLHPDSRTVKGFWIACEPIVVTSENDKSLWGAEFFMSWLNLFRMFRILNLWSTAIRGM